MYCIIRLMDKKITAQKVVTTSVVVSLLDIFLNTILAYLSGSVVMLSQALEGVADLTSAGLLLVGLKRSKIPSSKKHPFGHGRELYFWTFLSALVTFSLTAGACIYFGLKRFINPVEVGNINLAIITLIVAGITNGYSSSLSIRRLLGKRSIINLWKTFLNSAFIETKTIFVIDVMGTIASLLGLISLTFYSITDNFRFDGLGAIVIGITIAFLALIILKGAKDLLVGQSASLEVEKNIRNITEKDPNVQKVLDLRTLQIGPNKLLINIEFHLADELSTDEIEKLIDKIEKEIKSEIPSASNIQIELETPDVEKQANSQ